MSDLRQKLQLIESTTNEASTQAGEKAAEKFGITTAAGKLRGTAAKARAKLAAATDKVAAATDKLPGGAERASTRAKKAKIKNHVASMKQHMRAAELRQAARAETNTVEKAALEREAQAATEEGERLSQSAMSKDPEAIAALKKDPEIAAALEKNPELVAQAAKDAEAGAEKAGGYTPMTRDPEAVAGLNAEQKQLSDYFAKPENHVVKDGKAYGRDPNKVGEFVELDAKTLLPKGQIGVNREIFHANGALNQELQALEKLGPREVEALETKALNSALTDVEKAEVKSSGIINWIKKNPKRAAALGLLAGIIAAGTIAQLMSSEEKKDEPGADEKKDPEDPAAGGDIGGLPSTTTSSDLTQTNPADLEKKILALIAELEKEPTCQADVVKLKADLARVKSGGAAVAPTPTPADATAADPKWMAAIEAIKKATGKSDQEVRDMVAKVRASNPAATPEQTQAQLAVGAPPVPGKDTAAPAAGATSGQLANPGAMPADMATQLAAQMNAPAAGGTDMMTGRDITGKPVMKGSPADVSGKDPLKIGGLAENDELARWLKIARG